MKKALGFAVVVIALVAVVKRLGPTIEGIDWEERFERMPDNAPPKWMYRNISTIRENTERILELLERDRPSAAGRADAP